MAKCPKCDNDTFVLEEFRFNNNEYGYMAVCCKNCNTVITFLEDRNISHHLIRMQEMLAIIMLASGLHLPLGDQQNTIP